MTDLVIVDASAGVELLVDSVQGKRLRRLVPQGATLWVPELFYVEVGSVLRRWSINHVIPDTAIVEAIRRLRAWPLHRARVRELFDEAWKLRHNFTFADGLYVALAVQLDAPVLTGDLNLANAPNLPVPVLHIYS